MKQHRTLKMQSTKKKNTPRKQNPMAESLLNKADSFSFTDQTE